MTVSPEMRELFVQQLFLQAIDEGRAAELLLALIEGRAATIDLTTGNLVIFTAEQMGPR